MKNLKKLLAVIISVAMIVAIMIPAFAEESFTFSAEAKKLYDMKLYAGNSATTYEPDLGSALTREAGMVLVVRLLGLADEAAAMTEADITAALANYTDVASISDWAKDEIAYAVKNGIVAGATTTTINPQGALLGKDYASMILRNIGYADADYNTACSILAEKGGLTAADAEKFASKELIRDDVAGISFQALQAKNSDGETVIAKLVAAEAVTEDAAVAAGVYTPAPDALAIEDVSSDNVKQLFVEFNMDIEDNTDATNADNYSFEDAEVDSVTADGNVLTINIKDGVDQQTEETLTVAEDVTGEEKEFDVKFFDTTTPEVESIEAIGLKTFKVTFSEPMELPEERSDRREGFTIKDSTGKKLYVSDVTAVGAGDEVNVAISAKLVKGTYSFTVENSYEDYAGFNVATVTEDVEVTPDTEAPSIVGYKDAKPYEVTLVFDDEVTIVGDEADFYHTNSKNPAQEAEVQEFKNEVKLTFLDTDRLPAGTAYVYVKAEAVEDLWGNLNDTQLKVEIDVTDDTTAPVISSVAMTEDNQSQITVTFDEDVDKDTAEDDDNYVLLDEDGEEVDDIIDVINQDADDKNVVKIDLNDPIDGDYTLKVEDVEDIYGNEMAASEFDFAAADVTAPDMNNFTAQLYTTDTNEQTLVISFDGEKMATDGTYSVNDLDKYQYTTDNGTTWISLNDDGLSISVAEGDKKVEIVLDQENDDKPFAAFAPGVDDLRIARVADAAGNKADDLYADIDITGAAGDIEASSFEATATDTLVLELDSLLTEFDKEDFKIVAYDGTGDDEIDLEIASVEEDSTGTTTKLTFTLDEDENLLNAAAKYVVNSVVYDVYVVADDDVDSVNEYDEAVDISLSDNVTADDEIAPSIADDGVVRATNTSIVITFTEDILDLDTAAKEAAVAGEFTLVDDEGNELDALTDYTIDTTDTNELTITLIGDYADNGGYSDTITFSTSKTSAFIMDAAENRLAQLDNTKVDVED